MAIVKSVEKVAAITLNNVVEPVTVNLTKGQDETQCIPFHTAHWDADPGTDFNDEIYYEVDLIDNAGTAAVQIKHSGRTETSDQIIEVFVVEFDAAINVNQYDVTGLTDTNYTTNVTITDVNSQSSAFMLYSAQNNGTADDDFDNACVRVSWNGASTTSVTVARRATGTTASMNGTLYVVDCDSGEFTVEHATLDRTNNSDLSDTITISSTVLADTFLLHSYTDNQAGDDIYDSSWHADLQNTTTVRLRRGLSGTPTPTASEHTVQVVECQNSEWSVQRNDALTLESAVQDDTITEIDQTKAIIICGHLQGGLSVPRDNSTIGSDKTVQAFGAYFQDNTTARFEHQNAASPTNSVVAYEVVEFELTGSGNPWNYYVQMQ